MIRGMDVLQNGPEERKQSGLENKSWWKIILYCMSFLLIFFVSLFAHYVIKKPLSFFLIRKPTKEILKWISIGFVLHLSVISIYLIFGKIELLGHADPLSLSKITYFVVATISMALLGGIIEEKWNLQSQLLCCYCTR